jgi:hypothetical protein
MRLNLEKDEKDVIAKLQIEPNRNHLLKNLEGSIWVKMHRKKIGLFDVLNLLFLQLIVANCDYLES